MRRRTEKRKAHSIDNNHADTTDGMEMWKRESRWISGWNMDEDEVGKKEKLWSTVTGG
jgi:hypothetical protein